MNLKTQKILIILAAIVITGFGIHFYLKFDKQVKVLKLGKTVEAEIVNISNKNKDGGKTYKVRVDEITDYLDWGPKEWENLKIGDKVKVKYLKGHSEIIPLTMKPNAGKYFSGFWVLFGVLITIYSIIYKPKTK